MSNLVYGFFETKELIDKNQYFKLIEEKTNLGVYEIRPFQLKNFPDHLFYDFNEKCVFFGISDLPGKSRATYLIDFIDYAPNSKIGFPYKAKDRLNIFINSLFTMIEVANAIRFVVAITDSCEIEETKSVNLSCLKKVISNDFDEYDDPPGKIYNIQIMKY